MSRRWWLLILGGVTLVVVAVIASHRNTATPITADELIASFEGAAGTAPGDPGVYEYSTTGFEHVDAFSGGRHDYPATTFMTISIEGCGPSVRWIALRERWVEWSHCGPDLGVNATVEHHEWFGITNEEFETCPDARPIFSEAIELVCNAGETAETYSVEVVGLEDIEVAGEPVATLHIRRVSSVTGATLGQTVVDVWRLPETPLIVRMEIQLWNTTSSAVGDVTYVEEAVLHLVALRPAG